MIHNANFKEIKTNENIMTIFFTNNDNIKKVCYINTMPYFECIFKRL